MSDDLMDARLRAAGDRWRAAEGAAATPAETAFVARPAPVVRHRARWVAAVSAAVIAAALVVSGAVLLANRATDGTPVAAPQPSESLGGAPQPSNPPATTPLVGTRWELTEVMAVNGAHSANGDAFLQFTKNRFVGSDGCNSLGGTATISTHTIELSDVFSTAMACPGSTASLVSGILASGTLQYRIAGSSLVLIRGAEGTLIYRAASASARQHPSQLVGPHWTLQGTEVTTHSGSNVSAEAHSAVAQSVLTFDGRGGFTVQHRCYTNQGKAVLGSGTADLSAVTLKTAVPCSSGTNVRAEQQENAFVDNLLRGRVSWHIDQDVLTISKGGHSATFSR